MSRQRLSTEPDSRKRPHDDSDEDDVQRELEPPSADIHYRRFRYLNQLPRELLLHELFPMLSLGSQAALSRTERSNQRTFDPIREAVAIGQRRVNLLWQQYRAFKGYLEAHARSQRPITPRELDSRLGLSMLTWLLACYWGLDLNEQNANGRERKRRRLELWLGSRKVRAPRQLADGESARTSVTSAERIEAINRSTVTDDELANPPTWFILFLPPSSHVPLEWFTDVRHEATIPLNHARSFGYENRSIEVNLCIWREWLVTGRIPLHLVRARKVNMPAASNTEGLLLGGSMVTMIFHPSCNIPIQPVWERSRLVDQTLENFYTLRLLLHANGGLAAIEDGTIDLNRLVDSDYVTAYTRMWSIVLMVIIASGLDRTRTLSEIIRTVDRSSAVSLENVIKHWLDDADAPNSLSEIDKFERAIRLSDHKLEFTRLQMGLTPHMHPRRRMGPYLKGNSPVIVQAMTRQFVVPALVLREISNAGLTWSRESHTERHILAEYHTLRAIRQGLGLEPEVQSVRYGMDRFVWPTNGTYAINRKIQVDESEWAHT